MDLSLRAGISRLWGSALLGRLARGATWSLLGTAATRVLALGVAIVTARLLGREQFGALAVVTSTVGMFQVFAGFGIGATATTHLAALRDTDPGRAGRILALSHVLSGAMGLAASVALFAGAGWLATSTLGAPHLAALLRVSSVGLLFSTVLGAQLGALAGFEAFRASALVAFVAGLLSVPVSIALVLRWGLHGAVWAQVITAVAQCAFAYLPLRAAARARSIPLRLSGWTRELPLLWSFALPALIAGVMVMPVNWLCAAILVNQPGGYDQMGAFNAANQWFGVMLLLPQAAGAALLPVMAERIGARDTGSARKLLKAAVALSAAVVAPLVVVLGIASPVIMGLYGAEFVGAWPALLVVLLTGAIAAVLGPVGVVLTASSRLWTGFFMNAAWAVVFVAFTYALAGRGAIGLASARLVAYGAHCLWSSWVAARLVRGDGSEDT